MIVRSKRKQRYVTIENDVIRDKRLSFKARGLLAYLLSLPDDWRISSQYLATVAPDGRDGIRTGLQELEQTGYLVRQRIQNPDNGRWSWQQVVHETPVKAVDKPSKLSTPEDGLPDVGKPGFLRNTYKERPTASSLRHSYDLCTPCNGNGYTLIEADEVERCPFCEGNGTK